MERLARLTSLCLLDPSVDRGEVTARESRSQSLSASPVEICPGPTSGGGKPREIELWSNLYMIHPMSRRLVTWLIPTPITPNQVSVLGVVAVVCAAAAYCLIAWPFGVAVGFALHIGWHILDGADGDLARRTGRSSPTGEIVDGICDYLSHFILYSALAVVLTRQVGGWAWLLAAGSGAARAVQANSYESRRRSYQFWMQGGSWLRQSLSSSQPVAGNINGVMRRLARGYLGISERVSGQDARLDAALEARLRRGGETATLTRTLYRQYQAGALRSSLLLSANARTVALFLSMLAGSPLYFFAYEILGLSLVLAVTLIQQRRRNLALLNALADLST